MGDEQGGKTSILPYGLSSEGIVYEGQSSLSRLGK